MYSQPTSLARACRAASFRPVAQTLAPEIVAGEAHLVSALGLAVCGCNVYARSLPSFTNIFAIARPMPLLAPVTRASLPVRAMVGAAVAVAVGEALSWTCSTVFCSIRAAEPRGAPARAVSVLLPGSMTDLDAK